MACRLDGAKPLSETNAGILLIGTLGTNFSEILVEIHTFSFKNIHLKMSSGKWRPFCLGLNVLIYMSDMEMQLIFLQTLIESLGSMHDIIPGICGQCFEIQLSTAKYPMVRRLWAYCPALFYWHTSR